MDMIHPTEPEDELVVCFNEEGKEIEPHTRRELHALPLRYWHGVTSIFVVNKDGQLLCSKRSEKLSQKPGRWQANFGGHVNVGQTFVQNAVRELKEESGIDKKETDLYFINETKNEEFKHIVKHFVCRYEGDLGELHFSDGEITEVKWMSFEEAWNSKLKNPELWAGSCNPENQEKIRDWVRLI